MKYFHSWRILLMRFFTKRWRVVMGTAGLVALAYAASAIWEATKATRDVRERLTSEAEVRFTVARLDRPGPAGFEWISSPAVFRDARSFQGRLYISGPPGLFEYDASGKLLARYR